MRDVTVMQAKLLAAGWVSDHGSAIPGFTGAFFHGSINWMSEDDVLPGTSDVDLSLVSKSEPLPPSPRKFIVENVLFEVGVVSTASFQSPEQLLGDHKRAGTFSKDCVISDPDGTLTRLQADVSRDFALRDWVRRRCESARAVTHGYLDALNDALPFYEQVTVLIFGMAHLTDMLMVAALKNTTVRRKYAVVRELLLDRDREHVYDTLLRQLGCSNMTASRAAEHLDRLEQVFDAASEVDKPGYRFAGDISGDGKRVAIDGSRELMETGHHRDAVFWLVATYSRCMNVFDKFGSQTALKRHFEPFNDLLADLGIESFPKRVDRRALVNDQIPKIWQEAESLIDTNPEVQN